MISNIRSAVATRRSRLDAKPDRRAARPTRDHFCLAGIAEDGLLRQVAAIVVSQAGEKRVDDAEGCFLDRRRMVGESAAGGVLVPFCNGYVEGVLIEGCGGR